MANNVDFTAKLDREQRMLVFRMHAEGFSANEIACEVKNRFDITISREAIRQTCSAEKNQPFIKHFRESFLAKVKEVPIANKRIRIDDLERVRKRLIDLIENSPLTTAKQRAEFISLSRQLNDTLSSAREEMENKPNLVAGVVVGDLDGFTDSELHERKRELIAKALKSVGGGTSGNDEDSESSGFSDSAEPS